MAALYEIRDPVHDFITFNQLERDVMDSLPMQRLKHIKQLALTHLVYPGATHTRFEHSVGTMQVASLAFDGIVAKGGSNLLALMSWSPDDVHRYRQVLRLGALLHDVGHSPFSHAPESLMPRSFDGHEEFTARIIRSEYLAPILDDAKPFKIEPEEVVAVALGPEKYPSTDASVQLLGDLVAGELGVDRIDYLVRDSLHSGSAAGRFDYQRLLNTMTVINHPITGSPVLALEAGGRYAAEGLVLARYFMFLGVYFHPVRRIYDQHLLDFLKEWLPRGRFPGRISTYLKLTDVEIESAIRAKNPAKLRHLASRLTNRGHFRVAFEVPQERLSGDATFFSELEQKAKEKFGELVKTDEPKKEAYTLETEQLYVVDPEGVSDILQISPLIESLHPMWVGRVYAPQEIRDEVTKFCRKLVT